MFVFSVGFPHSSVGKESACNGGDSGSIPESRRSAGEGIGHPPQCSWASFVTQLVKYRLQCGRPGFHSWVGKIPWRRERLPTPVFWHSSILAWTIPGNIQSMRASPVAQSVKNLPAFQETWVRFLNWEDSLEKGNGKPLQYSCLEYPHGPKSLTGYSPWNHKSRTLLSDFHFSLPPDCNVSLLDAGFLLLFYYYLTSKFLLHPCLLNQITD